MNSHKGMRPQDVVILCQIALSKENWKNQDLASALKISAAEISYSLLRSSQAGLLSHDKTQLMKQALLSFIQHGLPYVFPAIKGPVTVGVPTAYSAPAMKSIITSDQPIVWPYPNGTARGESIGPLYPKAVMAALENQSVYELLALLDVMRVGKVREKRYALDLLTKKMSQRHA